MVLLLAIFNRQKKTRSYVGATTDAQRRLRQHNGRLAGGVRYAVSNRPWQVAAHVFVGDKIRALKLEWKFKRARDTGKSTALNLVKRGINVTQISVLDCSTFEQQFGLSQIIDSAFVAINEFETECNNR